MGFLDKLKGIGSQIVSVAIKIENKDLMEAMIASSVIVAYADGELSDEERVMCNSIIKSSTQLTAFGDESSQLFETYCKKYEASGRMAHVDLMKEIKDVANNGEDSVRVLIMAIEVADADNNIDADEMKMLNKIAEVLNLKLDDYI